jgi:hypothetical protein
MSHPASSSLDAAFTMVDDLREVQPDATHNMVVLHLRCGQLCRWVVEARLEEIWQDTSQNLCSVVSSQQSEINFDAEGDKVHGAEYL